jgi:hypothetical protein
MKHEHRKVERRQVFEKFRSLRFVFSVASKDMLDEVEQAFLLKAA